MKIIYTSIVIVVFLLCFFVFYKIWNILAVFDEKLNNKKFGSFTQANKTQQNKNNYSNRNNQNNQNNQNNKSGYEQNTNSPKENKIPDCLLVLGFTKIPENKDDIKTRYRKLSKIYHPDMGGTQEEFERITKAWDEARKLYELK